MVAKLHYSIYPTVSFVHHYPRRKANQPSTAVTVPLMPRIYKLSVYSSEQVNMRELDQTVYGTKGKCVNFLKVTASANLTQLTQTRAYLNWLAKVLWIRWHCRQKAKQETRHQLSDLHIYNI